MKNRFKKSILLTCVAITVILMGCTKNFIDKSPNDSVAASTALNSVSALQDALNGAYSGLRSTYLFGRDLPVIGDLQADNTYVEIRNSGRYLQEYNYSLVSSDAVFGEIWNQAYAVILRVNEIIDASVTGTGAAQVKAEVYAIRALLYFKLINIYARPYTDTPNGLGVPLILHYNPSLFPARSTITQVYTQIVSDLQTAFTSANAYSTSVRLNKYAIEGLLAKAYFFMGDNTNAKKAAVDVITNGGFALVSASNYAAFWADAAARTDAVETMFEVDCDAINNNGFDDLGGIYINGYQDIYASSQLYNLYTATDVRRGLMIPGTTKSGASAYLVNKFPNAENQDRDNLKVLRLSEVYLIAAESSLPSNESDAKLYLNKLVAQRDPSFAGYTSTGTTLLNNIVLERRKETAFEGTRLYDLNRLKLDITRAANPGAIPAGTGNTYLTIPYSSNFRVAPIPQGEITANANIASQQNPGY